MGTKIEWVKNSDGSQGKTWNPVTGCTKISPGCLNCYAERMSKRLAGRCGYPADEPFRVTRHHERLEEPLRWRKPQMVFVCSMGDLFHDDVPDGFIMDVWRIMGRCQQHTFQILTKRPERMKAWFERWADAEGDNMEFIGARGPVEIRMKHKSQRAMLFAEMLDGWGAPPEGCAYPLYDWAEGVQRWPTVLPNVWLGVTVEDQQRADKRIPLLLQTPAAVRFVSVEPMLSSVNLRGYLMQGTDPGKCANCGKGHGFSRCPNYGGINTTDNEYNCTQFKRQNFAIHQVIVGCESGPKRRHTDIAWIRSLRDQCVAADVPFFLKQMDVGDQLVKMPELDGRVWADVPERGAV
jgi:protein gp37